ncbi:hypothetical protein ACQY0O_003996 [Thecaphora frezii]
MSSVSTMRHKPADPKDVCGIKRLVFMHEGTITEMGLGHPCRLMPKMENLTSNQTWDIKYDEKEEAYCITQRGKDIGLHYPRELFIGSLVTMDKNPSMWKIYEGPEGGYLICPMEGESRGDIRLAPSSMLVFPPLLGFQPRLAGVFSWSILNA